LSVKPLMELVDQRIVDLPDGIDKTVFEAL
jgi:hypothetical protein